MEEDKSPTVEPAVETPAVGIVVDEAAEVEAAVAETGISATATFGTAEGTRREGTFSRVATNGFVEIVDAATGEVIARHEQGAPDPD